MNAMKLTKKKLTWIYLTVLCLCLLYSFLYYSIFIPEMERTFRLEYYYFFTLIIVPLLFYTSMSLVTLWCGLTMTKVSKGIKSLLKLIAFFVIGIHIIFIVLFYLNLRIDFFGLFVNYILCIQAWPFLFGVVAIIINMDLFLN